MRERIAGRIGSGLGWGLGVGIAIGLSAVVGGGVRPAIKGAVKGGLWAKDRATIVVAEARERAEDIYHEARSERAQEDALLNGATVSLAQGRPARPVVSEGVEPQ